MLASVTSLPCPGIVCSRKEAYELNKTVLKELHLHPKYQFSYLSNVKPIALIAFQCQANSNATKQQL